MKSDDKALCGSEIYGKKCRNIQAKLHACSYAVELCQGDEIGLPLCTCCESCSLGCVQEV